MGAGGQAAAAGTDGAASAACGTFEAILAVLYQHAEDAGHMTACFITAATLAADGRDALITAPALAHAFPLPVSLPPLPAGASLEDIADALARHAHQLAADLRGAAAHAASRPDRDALGTAAQSAQALCCCLAGTGEC
jgi:hypothetical protein